MAMTVRDVNGTRIEVRFMNGGAHPVIEVGDLEFPAEEFVRFAAHFLAGEYSGWGKDVPSNLSKELNFLVAAFNRDGNRWERVPVGELARRLKELKDQDPEALS